MTVVVVVVTAVVAATTMMTMVVVTAVTAVTAVAVSVVARFARALVAAPLVVLCHAPAAELLPEPVVPGTALEHHTLVLRLLDDSVQEGLGLHGAQDLFCEVLLHPFLDIITIIIVSLSLPHPFLVPAVSASLFR